MPYNNTAILPRHEPTGTTQLPLSRIKKIIGVDSDIHMCSNNAAFVITLATEMFIQYMAEQGHNVVKSERKPRRNIQYRDLSSAVSHLDNLEFLSDIIPRTIPYKVVKSKAQPHPTTNNSNNASHPSNPKAAVPNDGGPSESPRGIAVHGLMDPPVPVSNGNNPALASASGSGVALTSRGIMNGFVSTNNHHGGMGLDGAGSGSGAIVMDEDEDPNAQLRMESQSQNQANGHARHHGDDVEMS